MLGLRVIRAILKKLWLVIAFPLLLGLTVFVLTRHQSKTYDSSMTIFTGISTAKVGLGESLKMDFYSANNTMDNLIAIFKSRSSIQNTSIQLLSMHLSQKNHNPQFWSWESYDVFRKEIPDSLTNLLRVDFNLGATEERLRSHLAEHPNGTIAKLLVEHRHYSTEKILEKLKAVRRASSDMIDISFESDDAAICMHTLRILADTYFSTYRSMKKAQNANSVGYFEAQLQEAAGKLSGSEARLKNFISQNKILNYYEQGKNLAVYEKEEEQQAREVRQKASGADNAMKGIEEKLYENRDRGNTIDSLAFLREEINQARAKLNSYLLNRPDNIDAIAAERSRIQGFYNDISRLVAVMYMQDFTVQGIPSNLIMTEWLNLFTEREKQLSYLELVISSKNMVSNRIAEFAPLGAELKRLEREVSVNESQYLSILHGLNMANLQRQSMEQSETQSLIDEPYFAAQPRKSKRMLLVVAATFAGLILVLSAIVASIIFDNTLQNATIATNQTGLKVIASFPAFNSKKTSNNKLQTIQMASNQLVNAILVESSKLKMTNEALKIVVYESVNSDELQSLIRYLQQSLHALQFDTNAFLPGDISEVGIGSYPKKPEVVAQLNWNQFPVAGSQKKGFITILGLPPLNKQPFPATLFAEANIVILSANAARQWKAFDKQLLGLVEDTFQGKPLLVLQNVDADHLKDFFGYIPAKSIWSRNRKKYM